MIFKKTTYRYEDGVKFIILTFKNEAHGWSAKILDPGVRVTFRKFVKS